MISTNQKINLREERDFSSKLNATFHFIRANFRTLLKTLFMYVTPLALAAGISSGIYQARVLRGLSGTNEFETYGQFSFFNQVTSVNYFFTAFFMLTSVYVLFLAVYSFMVVYQDEEGEVNPAAVWLHMKEHLVKVIFGGVLIALITFLSLFLLGLGLYLGVVLSLFVVVMVREDLDFIETVERCFTLIKGNWWATFGLIIVAGFIQGVVTWLTALPLFAIGVMRGLQVPGMDNDLLLVVVQTISSVLGIYIYAISAIAIGFQYFNLVEKKEGLGLLEQADLIGRHNLDTSANEGQY
ncbi:hypothetical protein [Botryobacter ruber]|uniref:hypothetical protein n=1 Tax=Botryobacter ruber TaxID=2171629 RepID=UPI000E0ADBE4|nr:hypothetical protein [Botryobacter ruber]